MASVSELVKAQQTQLITCLAENQISIKFSPSNTLPPEGLYDLSSMDRSLCKTHRICLVCTSNIYELTLALHYKGST